MSRRRPILAKLGGAAIRSRTVLETLNHQEKVINDRDVRIAQQRQTIAAVDAERKRTQQELERLWGHWWVRLGGWLGFVRPSPDVLPREIPAPAPRPL